MQKILYIVTAALICGVSGLIIGTGLSGILPPDAPILEYLVFVALMVVIFYAAFLVQTAIHEGGHYVFGKLSGYEFISYRFMDLMWKRENGKIVMKRFSLAGTGGQCLMDPPGSVDDDVPYMLYNMGGVILNAVSALVFFAAAALVRKNAFLWTVFMLLGATGIFHAVMNGVPVVTEPVNNDGRNALEIRRNKSLLRPFLVQLKVYAKTSQGIRLRDMPDEWFTLPKDKMDDALSASAAIIAENRLMDEMRLHEAAQLAHLLLEDAGGLMPFQKLMLREDIIYLSLIGEDGADVETIRTEQFLKEEKPFENSLSMIRTGYTYALIKDHKDDAYRLLRQFEKVIQTYPYAGEIESEKELMRYAEGYAALMKKQSVTDKKTETA